MEADCLYMGKSNQCPGRHALEDPSLVLLQPFLSQGRLESVELISPNFAV